MRAFCFYLPAILFAFYFIFFACTFNACTNTQANERMRVHTINSSCNKLYMCVCVCVCTCYGLHQHARARPTRTIRPCWRSRRHAAMRHRTKKSVGVKRANTRRHTKTALFCSNSHRGTDGSQQFGIHAST